jgi:hypothetical protein
MICAAHEKLLSAIYDDLRAIARKQMSGEPATHSFRPTALVNEAYMRLVGSKPACDRSPTRVVKTRPAEIGRSTVKCRRKPGGNPHLASPVRTTSSSPGWQSWSRAVQCVSGGGQ